jgi:hypothetical protein
MTCSNAVQIVYLDVSDENEFDWEFFVEDVQLTIRSWWPSFEEVSVWDGKEERRILENQLAKVVLCEYCGLASINLVPCEFTFGFLPLAEHWCHQIANKFAEIWPDRLRSIGRASNGEQFFERVNNGAG